METDGQVMIVNPIAADQLVPPPVPLCAVLHVNTRACFSEHLSHCVWGVGLPLSVWVGQQLIEVPALKVTLRAALIQQPN